MPITLVTGLPGHGKTLYTLARWKAEAEKAGRPVFHNSIPGLNIPGWQPWEVKDWQNLPAGSLMIVDEAQFAFPVTGRGQTPEWVQKLATHRHLGLDFIVITQNPMLLDSFVRKLVDRHFHVVRKFGTSFATIYEFVNGVKEDVAKNRNDGIRSEFRYPKEVFDWYKSAELHTVKRRIPARVYLLLVLPVLFIGLVYVGYQRMKPETKGEEMKRALNVPDETGTGHDRRGESRPPTPGGSERLSTADYTARLTPRIAGLPHTAPAYDGVTAPTKAPYPAACIASVKRCQCYSQQGTKLDMADELCRTLADGGFFLAWNTEGDRVNRTEQREERQRQQRPEDSAQSPAPTFTTNASPAEPAPEVNAIQRRIRRVAQP